MSDAQQVEERKVLTPEQFIEVLPLTVVKALLKMLPSLALAPIIGVPESSVTAEMSFPVADNYDLKVNLSFKHKDEEEDPS